ncbi:MAG TPA: hypothetical protein VLB80_02805 [Candidatus Babeliales bacterium]|nr:hypothetical protein [Candidatus Babeliales bacterium]
MKNYPAPQTGSIILTIIIIMTIALILMHAVIRTSSFFMLLAREREMYEQTASK